MNEEVVKKLNEVTFQYLELVEKWMEDPNQVDLMTVQTITESIRVLSHFRNIYAATPDAIQKCH